jgi:chemotaxis protein MotB
VGKKAKKGDEAKGAPMWVVTYGDMMSLLMTFFVLLLSFSTISEEKISQARTSFNGALGLLPKFNAITQPVPNPQSLARRVPRSIERLARELRRQLQIMGKDSEIDIEYDQEGGLKINLPGHVLFDTARAELRPEASDVLSALASLLVDIPDKYIEVRGHTDSRPLSSNRLFKDNYDLAYHRAKNVMLYLSREGAIPEREFEVVACGSSQPIASNETDEGMRANRRVEIKVRGEFEKEMMEEIRETIDAIAPLSGANPVTRTPEPGNEAPSGE